MTATGPRITVVGDALLDADVCGAVERVCPDGPAPVLDELTRRWRPGGAALAASLAVRAGATVDLVTALGDDRAGRTLGELLAGDGVTVHDLGLDGPTPQKVRFRVAGQALLRVDRGGPPAPVVARAGALASAEERLAASHAVVVADYGRGVAATEGARRALARSQRRPAPAPVVWDPHPRGAPPLRATLVTPNRAEARLAVPSVVGDDLAADAGRAARLVQVWGSSAVAVTRGADGALLATGAGSPLVVPAAPAAPGADTCGAGDAFAVGAALALASGRVLSQAVVEAVRFAAAFVADGGAGAWCAMGQKLVRADASGDPNADSSGAPSADSSGDPSADPSADPSGLDAAVALAHTVRGRGGTVVATGGCFDLLHAGHVSLLETARRLGDTLVVFLNADTSVRRLKGPDRPLQSQNDRRAVLAALAAVDAVVVFDDDTPLRVLEQVRPHLFVKGGDYGGVALPEAPLCATWGGHTITVPYLSGRSTTQLVEEVRRGR